MNKQPVNGRPTTEADANHTLLQLHLAEYQALTTRASYWIVLQYGLMGVVPVYLALGFQAWQSAPVKEVVIWATLAFLQFTGLLWALTMLEQFAIVKYIECYLRPLIRESLAADRFWGYEPHLVKNRPYSINSGHFIVPAIILLVIVATFATRVPYLTRWDIAGVATNVALQISLWYFSNKSRKMVLEWSNYDREFAKSLNEDYGCDKASKTSKEDSTK